MKTNSLTEQDLAEIGPVEISEVKNFFIEFEVPDSKFSSENSDKRYETNSIRKSVKRVNSDTSILPVDFFEQSGFEIEDVSMEENAAGNKTVKVFIMKEPPEATADNLLQTLQALFGVKSNGEVNESGRDTSPSE